MQRNRTRIVGILTVAGLAAVGFAVADTEPEPTAYCAQLPDAIGLYAGNPVTRMGVPIGTIDRIEAAGGHVEVGFTIEAGHRIPADVAAVTRSKSILADRSLELVGAEVGPELAAGSCIPLDRGHTPKSISEITGSAADFIAELSPDNGQRSFETAVAGFAEALRGQGPRARELMLHAAAAANSPDRLIADIGAIIRDMAPLTDEALRNWPAIRSILDQMPAVVAAGIDLWPGVIDVCVGVGWLVNVLHDVHTGYGDLLWPALRGPLADAIHLAAGRSGDIRGLIESIPAVAALLRQQTGTDGAMVLAYQPTPGGPLDLLFQGGPR
ncbi:MlaD family protein [Nocardia barduliensis]|uniref:MlaD family protein n=1 Tax=Nocardia barduliensis TaxID=2736643 RepID=UPI0015743C0B|nr:MlaD family protein [Nocardia barduliensis]